jgi:hypothetical protein
MSSYTLSNTITNITTLLGLYCIKYMYAIHNTSKSIKSFQTVLLNISQWNDKTVLKEYQKFLKWTKKRKIDDFQKQIKKYVEHKILFLTKQTLEIDIDYTTLFHKCLKTTAKLFYRHPKDIYSISEKKVMQMIQNTINSLIPLDKIFELVEVNYSPSTIYSYQIDEEDNHSISEVKLGETKSENENNDIRLKYIPSEEYFNEYYESELSDTSTNKNIKDIFLKKKVKKYK